MTPVSTSATDVPRVRAGSLKKVAVVYVVMGSAYFSLEGLWRGWTHVVMWFIGGLCGVVIDLLNENDRYYKLKVWIQSLVGLLLIWTIELTTGCIVNLWLGWHVWDYSKTWGNVLGQICLPYGLLFFALVPFGTWLGDFIRWKLFGETDRHYKLREIYWELITGR